MKQLTPLQEEFIKLLDTRFGLELVHVYENERCPEFESLMEVENELLRLKDEHHFRDSSEEID